MQSKKTSSIHKEFGRMKKELCFLFSYSLRVFIGGSSEPDRKWRDEEIQALLTFREIRAYWKEQAFNDR